MQTFLIIAGCVWTFVVLLYWLAYFVCWIGMQFETLAKRIDASGHDKRRAAYRANPQGYTRAELRAGYGKTD